MASKPDAILANGTPSIVSLKKATTSIPIVCALVQDPVGLGLVASLARPGGNITGFTYINPELIGKWEGLLSDVAPSTKRAGMLFNPAINPQYFNFLRDLGRVAQPAIDIVPMPVHTIETLRAAMAELGRTEGGAAIMAPDPFMFSHGKEAASLALQYRLPTISVYRRFASEGGCPTGPMPWKSSADRRPTLTAFSRERTPQTFRCSSRTSSSSPKPQVCESARADRFAFAARPR